MNKSKKLKIVGLVVLALLVMVVVNIISIKLLCQKEPESNSQTNQIISQTPRTYIQIKGYNFLLEPENQSNYNRDEYGNHNSDLCQTNEDTDPFTDLEITTCHIDHVVSLKEAHQSGAWQWDISLKKRFSQDPDNHLPSLACVNQSKSDKDIAEWNDDWISQSKACNDGYSVTQKGRCLFAEVTLKVKSKWSLSVNQKEADILRVAC